ncbi:MAG: tail fiber domain-containing protein [Deltaproteobacteria bacterium]|nr:tail fiber domain-containing protein [Deltaproteobacteria bacterium]
MFLFALHCACVDVFNKAMADTVIAEDLIVQDNLCAGMYCENGEAFSHTTLKLKEDNLRIEFEDTSDSASFPSTDWTIVINDTSNGGANYYSIKDVDNGKNVFKIEGKAPLNSLYADSNGQVGIRTPTPNLTLHINEGDTPSIRLDQDGSAGWAGQIWDIAGNEANFFIRDQTHGNSFPFCIEPGTPGNRLSMRSSGNIGLGTWSPTAKLDVVGNAVFTGNVSIVHDTEAKILLQNTSATVADRELLALENAGVSEIRLTNTDVSSDWKISNKYDWLIFQKDDNGYAGLSMTGDGTTRVSNAAASYIFDLDPSGNLAITGSLTAAGTNYPSDRSLKENLEEVGQQQILDALSHITITTWNYVDNSPSIRHMGTMAQDFYAAFNLGADDRHISPLDTAGVSFAAIQALNQKPTEKESEIEQLQQQYREIIEKLEQLAQCLTNNSP